MLSLEKCLKEFSGSMWTRKKIFTCRYPDRFRIIPYVLPLEPSHFVIKKIVKKIRNHASKYFYDKNKYHVFFYLKLLFIQRSSLQKICYSIDPMLFFLNRNIYYICYAITLPRLELLQLQYLVYTHISKTLFKIYILNKCLNCLTYFVIS